MNEQQQVTESPEFKRWTAKRKARVVLDLLKGKTTIAEVSGIGRARRAGPRLWRGPIGAGPPIWR